MGAADGGLQCIRAVAPEQVAFGRVEVARHRVAEQGPVGTGEQFQGVGLVADPVIRQKWGGIPV
ncbi:hypothetical protein [Kitasatospora sp. NPDC085464]|uniref:hypothetical protein n=1 Tax=Kitasatospora sp. NPDC085464 TaxID=3364063 RepID=UPI0037CA08CE